MQRRFVWLDGRWLLAVLETTTGRATVSFVFSLAYLYGGGCIENGVTHPLEVTHFRAICWKEIIRDCK